MKNLSYSSARFLLTLLLVFSIGLTGVSAQSANASCNVPTPLISSAFPNLTVTSSTGALGADQFSNKANLTDGNLTNASTYSFLISLLSSNVWVEVKDNNASGANAYPAGSFAGFVVNDNTLLSTLGSFTITTYLGSTAQETVASSSLLSTSLLSGQQQVGFYTTKAFDRIRLTYTTLVGVAGSVGVYYAMVERFCPSTPLTCNVPAQLNNPGFGTHVDPAQTGLSGIGLGAVSNSGNVVSASTTDYATLTLNASVLGSANLAVTDPLTTYPAGTFAGFDVENSALLGANLLSNYVVSTYLNGVLQESSGGGNSLLSVGLPGSTGRQTIGFVTTKPFNEIKLTVSKLVSANLETTNVYAAVATKFCAGPALACNTLTPVGMPDFPLYIDGANSGVNSLACVGCSVSNSQNAIDNNASSYASINLTAGVAATGSFAIADPVDTYPAGTFAGFDIQTSTLLSLGALSSAATIQLLNNGTVVQTGSGNALVVGATSSLLSGVTRQTVGIVANQPFDEVKISFNQVVGADLGNIQIYGAVLEKTCAATLACNSTFYLNSPGFGAVINAERTGLTGVACVACTTQDAWNAVSSSTTDYARLTNVATGLATNSLSVLDPADIFPAGTFAGFSIDKSAFAIAADLLPYLTVTTYLNGVQQESKSASDLLDLNVLTPIFGTSGFYNLGFTTTAPFNEIQLNVGSLAGALANYVDVYGAFVDTRNVGTALGCPVTTLLPDAATTPVNVAYSGNSSSNDITPTGTTYGQPAGATTSPSGAVSTLTVNPDGTYTFQTNTPGLYTYDVPVCAPGLPCVTEQLSITATPSSPLPVQIVSFTAKPSGPDALLEWITSNEQNNAYFEVRHSEDARTFEPIGRVAGSGNSSGRKAYSFIHTHPDPTVTHYYQLRQVDLNGSYTDLPVRSVQFGGGVTLRAHANPDRQVTVFISVKGTSSAADVSLLDLTGRPVFTQRVQLTPGTSVFRIPASQLPSGVYLISVRNDEYRQAIRVVLP